MTVPLKPLVLSDALECEWRDSSNRGIGSRGAKLVAWDSEEAFAFSVSKSVPVHNGDVPPSMSAAKGFRSLTAGVVEIADVYYWPKWGVCIDAEGYCLQLSAAAAQYKSPRLLQLPGIVSLDGVADEVLSNKHVTKSALSIDPQTIGSFSAGLIWMSWGAKQNYGHFMCDSLPAAHILLSYAQSGEPFLTPPLTDWQRQLIAEARIPKERVVEIEDQIVKVRRASVSTTMDHYLQRPGRLTSIAGQSIAAAVPPSVDSGRIRLFLTRRGDAKRALANIDELEVWATKAGFVVADPSKLTIREQIQLFKRCSLVVGEAGAGFANIIFSMPTCPIVTICPTTYHDLWLLKISSVRGNPCHMLWCATDRAASAEIGGVKYDSFLVSYRVDIGELDALVKSVSFRYDVDS